MEQTVTEQKTTMKRQKLRDYNKENSAFGELGNSPEGKRLVGGLSLIIKRNLLRKIVLCYTILRYGNPGQVFLQIGLKR